MADMLAFIRKKYLQYFYFIVKTITVKTQRRFILKELSICCYDSAVQHLYDCSTSLTSLLSFVLFCLGSAAKTVRRRLDSWMRNSSEFSSSVLQANLSKRCFHCIPSCLETFFVCYCVSII